MVAALEIDAPPFKYPIGICSICSRSKSPKSLSQVSQVDQLRSASSRNELNALASQIKLSCLPLSLGKLDPSVA